MWIYGQIELCVIQEKILWVITFCCDCISFVFFFSIEKNEEDYTIKIICTGCKVYIRQRNNQIDWSKIDKYILIEDCFNLVDIEF